jgi:hypothetical protein
MKAVSVRKHRGYVRHILAAHRTGALACKFKGKCLSTFNDRGKLLGHIKERHYTPTGKFTEKICSQSFHLHIY